MTNTTYHPPACTAYYAQLSVTAECATRTRDAKLSDYFLGKIGVACATTAVSTYHLWHFIFER